VMFCINLGQLRVRALDAELNGRFVRNHGRFSQSCDGLIAGFEYSLLYVAPCFVDNGGNTEPLIGHVNGQKSSKSRYAGNPTETAVQEPDLGRF